ncbi:MAG: DUF7793 family protein [Bacteroidia bacterium]
MVCKNEKIMETDTFRLRLFENGYAELMIRHGAVYDVKDIIEGKEFLTSRLEGRKAFILLELEGDVYTTREARELAASPKHSAHHGAIAIYSDKLAAKLLGNIYIRINKPKAPTRFFSRREEAVQWLQERMNADS